MLFRVAEVVRGHGGPPLKSLDSDENFHDHFFPQRKAAKFCHPGVVHAVFQQLFDILLHLSNSILDDFIRLFHLH